jgi:hypothetical protein
MSLSKSVQIFSGRKRESEVWKHFNYIEHCRKSQCTVVDEKSKKPCGMLIAGKNPTNLKSHLSSRHEVIFAKIKSQEDQVKAQKRKKESAGGMYISVQNHDV